MFHLIEETTRIVLAFMERLPQSIALEVSVRVVTVIAYANGMDLDTYLAGVRGAYESCVSAQALARTTQPKAEA